MSSHFRYALSLILHYLFCALDWFLPGIENKHILAGRSVVLGWLITFFSQFFVFFTKFHDIWPNFLATFCILAAFRLRYVRGDGIFLLTTYNGIAGVLAAHAKYIGQMPNLNLFHTFRYCRTCMPSAPTPMHACSSTLTHYQAAAIYPTLFTTTPKHSIVFNAFMLLYPSYLYYYHSEMTYGLINVDCLNIAVDTRG
jgi:hypothetical protein